MDPKELGFKALLLVIMVLIVAGLIFKLPGLVNQIKRFSLSQSGEVQTCAGEPTNKFIWPTRGLPDGSKVIVSCKGARDTSTCETTCSANHQGIDIRGGLGEDVLAVADGTVTSVGGNYNTIIIDHGEGYKTRYLHNSKIIVRNGERVVQGDIIAEIGGWGPKGPNSYPVHLHFEIMKDNKQVDPLCFYDRSALELKYAESSNCYYNRELYSYESEIKKNTLYA